MSSVATETAPQLVVDRLTKLFGDRLAVDEVSLDIDRGRILGLLGPNGAGKSTTMSMICGLVAPDSGSVTVGGERLDHSGRDVRRRIGLVPQEIALYPELTSRENVTFFGGLQGLSGRRLRERIDFVLDEVQLGPRAADAVATLSGGMKRRLNVAVALTHEPDLLVLDEPTVGVDPQSRLALLDAVRRAADRGAAVLLASHQMYEVEAVCDHVAVMDHGRVLRTGTVADLLHGIPSRAEVVVEGAEPAVGRSRSSVVEVESSAAAGKATVTLLSQDHAALVDELTRLLATFSEQGRRVLEIRKSEPSLEQLFFDLTGRTLRD